MTGRDWALCVITGLWALSAAGGAAAAVMARRKAPEGLQALAAAVTVTCGAWGLLGIAWWLSGGQVT